MDRRTIFLMIALMTVCIMAVSGQIFSDRRDLSKKDRGGGGRINRPNEPKFKPTPRKTTTAPGTAERVVAPSVKSSLNVAGRRHSGSIKSTGRVQASIQSTGRQSSRLSASSSQNAVPDVFQAEPITNKRLASSTFKQGDRVVQASAVKSSGGQVQHSGSVIVIYISPDFTFVILFGQYYPVINGKIYIFGKSFIVCQYTIALASNYICCNHNVHAAYDNHGTPASCCGDSYYYPSKEICCDSEIYPKYHAGVGLEATCCGNIFYYTKKEICCSKLPYLSRETGCCNGQAYDKSKYCCYGGYVYNNWVSYCGGCHNTHTTVCCNGKQHNKKYGYECCGHSYINTANRKCCNGNEVKYLYHSCGISDPCSAPGTTCCNNAVIDPYKTGCCGNKKYSKLNKQCCKGSVKPVYEPCHGNSCSGFGDACCGNEIINPLITGCCGGTQTYSKANEQCCNGVVDYNYQPCVSDPCAQPGKICCAGVSHTISTYPHKICCGTSYVSSATYSCCSANIINKATTGCCNGQAYFKQYYKCCYNVLKPKYAYC